MNGTSRKAAAEFLGTLLFVFAIVAAVNSGEPAALPIGFSLMVLVYATVHISGGHLNPAVSLGAYLRGALTAQELTAYVVSQVTGGLLGAVIAFSVWPPAQAMQIAAGPAFVVELIFTFILVYVVLNVATSKDHPNNFFYGLAIGSVVFIGAASVGAISGGAFNPAVSLGLAVHGELAWSTQWLYIVAALLGGVLAAYAFRLLNTHEYAE